MKIIHLRFLGAYVAHARVLYFYIKQIQPVVQPIVQFFSFIVISMMILPDRVLDMMSYGLLCA